MQINIAGNNLHLTGICISLKFAFLQEIAAKVLLGE